MKTQTDYVLKGVVIDGQPRRIPFCLRHKCFMSLGADTGDYRRYTCNYGKGNPDLYCGVSVDVVE